MPVQRLKSARGAADLSPARERWVSNPDNIKPQRGDRLSSIAPSSPNCEWPQHISFHLPEIDARRLWRSVNLRHDFFCFQINHFDSAGLFADAFDGKEGEEIIWRDDHAVDDFAFGRQAGKFFPGCGIENGN